MIESRPRASRTEIASERGLCVAGHVDAARAGAQILAEGGNAVDALVAAGFATYVVEPWNCGLGGYGHLTAYVVGRDEFVTVDHYLRAPRGAGPTLFEVDESAPEGSYALPQVVGRRNMSGHLSPGVPGAVAGLCRIHEELGVLPLPQVLAPAVEAAEAGLLADWQLELAITFRLPEIEAHPHAAAFLLPNGRVPRSGVRLEQPALAGLLHRIGAEGAAAFYDGAIPAAIEREVSEHGGVMRSDDLAAYAAQLFRERPRRYRDVDYVTAYDPLTYEVLNILDCFDLRALDPDGVPYRHVLAEALGHAFVDNVTLFGDPSFVRSPVEGISSAGYGRVRAAQILFDAAAPRPIDVGDPWPFEPGGGVATEPVQASLGGITGTSQVATVDAAGNAAALCTSVSYTFGAVVYIPEGGFFLNNGMCNFDPRPGRANSIAPGKTPIFAAPALVGVRDGRVVFAGSGSGGYRITSGVVHALSGVLDFDRSPQCAVDAPRVHCQGKETFVDVAIPEDVREGLRALGHDVVLENVEPVPSSIAFGRVSTLAVDADGVARSGTMPALTTAAAAP
jgi:gamma-glutamyltranspeptidase / glutathione hydrolase